MDPILSQQPQQISPVENIQSQPFHQNKGSKKRVLLIFLMLFIILSMLGIFAGLYYFSKPNSNVHSGAVVTSPSVNNNQEISPVPSIFSQTPVVQSQLVVLANNKYAQGNLPLGDNKYVTDNPKKGYV